MPEDYYPVSEKHGYSCDSVCGLILHVFSKHHLTPSSYESFPITNPKIIVIVNDTDEKFIFDFIDNITEKNYNNASTITANVVVIEKTYTANVCVNKSNILDKYLLNYVKYIFARLGFYYIYAVNSKTLFARDHHCNIVYDDNHGIMIYVLIFHKLIQ